MENSETDREITDLIKSTLDNYEEQYILGSWENFSRRRRRRKKLILLLGGTGIAASLLIGWIGVRFILTGPLSSSPESQVKGISSLEFSPERDTIMSQSPLLNIETISAGKDGSGIAGHDPALHSESGSRVNNQAQNMIPVTLNTVREEEGDTSVSAPEIYPSEKSMAYLPKDIRALSADSVTDITDSLVSEDYRSDSAESTPVYREADIMISPDNEMVDKAGSKRIRLGVNVSPGVTSTSTASSFSYSGGVNADLDLSRSFRLSAGVQVERQDIINENPDSPDWIPPEQTQAEILNLDLPLNITWKFLIRKSSCYYISSGISSIVYLSEKYTNTSYTQKMVQTVDMMDGEPNISYQLENVKTTQEETEPPLNTFDFAGRVNIMIGFEQHLSSRLFLHLEPYIKIPLSELGTQNIKYTTSGITCKISF
jgi:hypothetical protein